MVKLLPSFSNVTVPGLSIGSTMLRMLTISIFWPGGCGVNFAFTRKAGSMSKYGMPAKPVRVGDIASRTRKAYLSPRLMTMKLASPLLKPTTVGPASPASASDTRSTGPVAGWPSMRMPASSSGRRLSLPSLVSVSMPMFAGPTASFVPFLSPEPMRVVPGSIQCMPTRDSQPSGFCRRCRRSCRQSRISLS